MTKNVMVIRQSIDRVVSLLARRKIRVTQRGTKAYVEYNKDGSVKVCNIPYLPDDAPEDYIAAVQGFLDHEVGHVLFSDVSVLKRAVAKGGRVANMANIIEDVFIERKMTEEFAGTGSNLQAVRSFYLDKIVKPNVAAALAVGDAKKAQGYLMVVAFRAWGGQAICADYLADSGHLPLIADLSEAIGEDLQEALPKLKNSADCLHLAERAVKRLAEWEEKKREEERAKREEERKKREKEHTPPPPDLDAPTEPGESSGSGTTRTEEAPKPEPRPDAGEEDKPAPDFGEDRPVEPPEPPGPEDEETGAAPGDEPEEGEAGTAPGSSHGTDDAADEEERGTEPVTAGEGSDPTAGEPEAADDDSAVPTVSDLFDTRRDFDEAISDAIGAAAREALEDADYRVFSTEWDEVVPAPAAGSDDRVAAMDAEVGPMVGVMVKNLERAVAAKSRVGFNPGQRRGRVNPSALFRHAVGDDRLFRSRYEHHSKSTRVSLLVDCSGSMNGSRIEMAGKAAYALSLALERLRIEHEVIGFTTRRSPDMDAAFSKEGEDWRVGRYGRNQAIYMPVFKNFHERLDINAKRRLAGLTSGPRWLSQNVDGECVQMAAHRLVQGSMAERHILMVLSDGEPACPPFYGLSEHLKKVVATLGKQIDVVGIGIQTTAVTDYYPKNIVLHDLMHLPTTVVSELSKLLLAK